MLYQLKKIFNLYSSTSLNNSQVDIQNLYQSNLINDKPLYQSNWRKFFDRQNYLTNNSYNKVEENKSFSALSFVKNLFGKSTNKSIEEYKRSFSVSDYVNSLDFKSEKDKIFVANKIESEFLFAIDEAELILCDYEYIHEHPSIINEFYRLTYSLERKIKKIYKKQINKLYNNRVKRSLKYFIDLRSVYRKIIRFLFKNLDDIHVLKFLFPNLIESLIIKNFKNIKYEKIIVQISLFN